MNDTEILQVFKKWLVAEEDQALSAGIHADDDQRKLDASIAFARHQALEEARNQLESLGVKFDV